jgi:hypothetical protein
VHTGHDGGGTGAIGVIAFPALAPPAALSDVAPVIPSGPAPVGFNMHGTVAS